MQFPRLSLITVLVISIGAIVGGGTGCGPVRTPLRPQADERLLFRVDDAWSPRTNLNADVAAIDLAGESLAERMESWRSRGYRAHLVCGTSEPELQRAIDAGVTAIDLNPANQPPETVARATLETRYSDAKAAYESRRAEVARAIQFVRRASRAAGRKIACYAVVSSPMDHVRRGAVGLAAAAQSDDDLDGFIAQVTPAAARASNDYQGKRAERVFESAFLEYSLLQNLARARQQRVWMSSSPIDPPDGKSSWTDRRANWRSMLVASLLQGEVYRYEPTPWPHLLFESGAMPAEFATELQVVTTALGEMLYPDAETEWYATGTKRVGVLVSDTMMFQRFEASPDADDAKLAWFHGLALPLLMRGIPIEPVSVEAGNLDRYKVLLLTYDGQKPPTPEFHDQLARWVRAGGALVVIDDDQDPYHSVNEWWNSPPMNYRTPRRHLFDAMVIERNREGLARFGSGAVVFASVSPAKLANDTGGADRVRELVRQAMDATKIDWTESTALVLRRGPYLIGAGMERASRRDKAFPLRGRFIALFDPTLPIVTNPSVAPGERVFFLEIRRTRDIGVIAAACRVLEETISSTQLVILTDGIEATNAAMCVKLPNNPKSVEIDGHPMPSSDFDFNDGVLRLRFVNHVKPTRMVISR